MHRYSCIQKEPIFVGGIVLTTIQPEEIEKIRMWRNKQIDALRQKHEISEKEQIDYFHAKVWPELKSQTPSQILLSIHLDGNHIGYGGLVHISWEDATAEVSFLLDTNIKDSTKLFKNVFTDFLCGIEKVAKDDLKLHKLTTETFSFRKMHMEVLERFGFLREGELIDQLLIKGNRVDSIIHGKIIQGNISNTPEKRNDRLKNVLVTSSSRKAPLIRSLKKTVIQLNASFQIIAGDSNGTAISKFVADDFWEMPELEGASSTDLLTKAIEMNIGLILPTRDGELMFWARNKQIFREHGIHVLVSEERTIEICLDKFEFFKFMKANGLNCIETFTVLPNFQNDRNYVVKERFGSGSKNVGLNLSLDAAREHALKLDFPIFQPMIEGREVSADVWVIPNFFESVVLRSRDLVENGESQITTVFRNVELERNILNMANQLDIIGAAVMQLIIDDNGQIHLLECNARIGGASTASIEAGSGGFLNLLRHYILGQDNIEKKNNININPLTQIRLPADEYRYDLNF